MDKETIGKLMREAGWAGVYLQWISPTEREYLTVPVTMEQIERFAKLVAEHRDKWWEEQVKVEVHEAVLEEREAVLDLVDDYAKDNTDLRDAIRARRNT